MKQVVIGGALLVLSWKDLQRGLQQGYRHIVVTQPITVPPGDWDLRGVTIHDGHDQTCFVGSRFTITGGRLVPLQLATEENASG